MRSLAEPPDVLVLGGGGILGEAWMTAVRAGLGEACRIDRREGGAYIGTSAGSIVSAARAAGPSPPDRLGRLPEQPPVPASGNGGGGPASVLARAAQLGVAA